MTDDELKVVASAAGMFHNDECSGDYMLCFSDFEDVKDFARRIAENEREACAALCEDMAEDDLGNIGGQCFDCANEIRARSNN